MNDDIRKLAARASKVGSPLPRKTDLQLFIDFLQEQGTIVNARPNEVEAEGYDVIRFFRPKGGLTQEHFDALAAIDPYASGMLSRAVVERLVIDRGFDGWRYTGRQRDWGTRSGIKCQTRSPSSSQRKKSS